MKKLLPLSLLMAFLSYGSQAQNSGTSHEEEPVLQQDDFVENATRTLPRKATSNIIWSEDFANGIPATWQNQGYDMNVSGMLTPNPLCQWEYRGPNTSPDISTGSRGQFSGSGPTITSPTVSNGFIIFDSDYLDSDGISGNRGGGVSPAPHIGTLSTDTIDLTGYPNVQVNLYSRARNFHSMFKLAVSNDGGSSFPDTVRFHPNLPVNSTNSSAELVSANISNTAGNQAMVVLQLIYEGFDDGSTDGYYYWQLDDMSIQEIPNHNLQFVQLANAPAIDILYPSGSPKYGNPMVEQTQPIGFDANLYNFGVLDQQNVSFKVDIKDGSGQVVTTLTSPVKNILASGDTGTFVDFTTTGTWTPTDTGVYTAVFYTETDSIPAAAPSEKDSLVIRVHPRRHGGHFGRLNNTIGSRQSRIALAQAFTFPNSTNHQNGDVLVDGFRLFFSSDSDPDGLVIVEVYDTAGFAYGSSGGPSGSPIAVKSFPLDTSVLGTWAYVDMTTNGSPLQLNSDAGYMVVVNLAPSPNADIQIYNDQTYQQAGGHIAMQRDDGTWFARYSNSLSLSNLLFELILEPSPVGLVERVAQPGLLEVYPQPAPRDQLYLEITEGGHYQIELYNLSGARLHHEEVNLRGRERLVRSFSNLPRGNYVLKVFNHRAFATRKITLE